jgi:hypothetical protein
MDLHESSYGVALMARRTPAWREVYVGYETGGEEKGGEETREEGRERVRRRGVRNGRMSRCGEKESSLPPTRALMKACLAFCGHSSSRALARSRILPSGPC